MTNKLGPGTKTMPVNMPAAWAVVIGQMAFKDDLSAGAWIRRAIFNEVERLDPAKALEFTEARRRRKSAALLGLVLSVSLAPFCGVDVDDMRKPVRSVRVSRKEGFDVV